MYKLHLTAEMEFYEATVIETARTEARIDSLLPGTKYTFVVYSVGTPSGSHDGMSGISSEVVERQTSKRGFGFWCFWKQVFSLSVFKLMRKRLNKRALNKRL